MTPAMCEVCHCRAATRIVNFGGALGVQFCEVCRVRQPADVVDVWRVRNAPQQRNSGQED